MPSPAEPPGTFPRPGVLGRTIRILLAALLLAVLVNLVHQAPGFFKAQTGWHIPGGDWWVAALACLWVLPGMVDNLLGRALGRWTLATYVTFLGVAVALDRLADGVLWAPPLALLILLLFIYVMGTAGLSFLIAAVAGTPG